MDPTEAQIREIERQLYTSAQAQWNEVWRSHRWEFQVLRWCLGDPALRTRILRFIDCLPALTDARDVIRHLREYFPEREGRLPAALRLGLAATRPSLLTAPAVAAATRRVATGMARLFLAGATLEDAAGPLRQMETSGFRITVDLLGETTVSQAEADRYTTSYLELIQRWSSSLASPVHLSLKLSSLAFPFDPIDPEAAWRQAAPRLKSIFQATLDKGGFLNIDMEQYSLRDLTLLLTQRLLEEYFPSASSIGVVIQAYLKDSEEVTRRFIQWAKQRGTPITVRLVRGAYWDSEVIQARQREWPCPVYTEKRETDACFERLTDLLLENHPHVRIAVATHNLRSIARAIVRSRQLKVPQERWECQVLYGVNEAVHRAVLRFGVPVRVYTPIGELIPGMAYLVRRILENTSQTSFLAAGLIPAEELSYEL